MRHNDTRKKKKFNASLRKQFITSPLLSLNISCCWGKWSLSMRSTRNMFCKCRLWADGRDFSGTPVGTRVPDYSVLQWSQLNWNWRNISCSLWNCLSDRWWLYRGWMTLGRSLIRGVEHASFLVFGLSVVYWFGIILNYVPTEVFLFMSFNISTNVNIHTTKACPPEMH